MKHFNRTFVFLAALALLLTGCGTASVSNDYVDISNYKGLEIQKTESAEVTDEDVENEIEYMLSNYMEETEITDRPASMEEMDYVIIDFAGTIDGVAFDGGTMDGASLQLGSGSMIAGFEEQIDGHNAGDQFEFDLAFPDAYTAEELAGKTAHWTITLERIYTQTVPEFNDAFVKEKLAIDGVSTADEYRAYLKEELTANAEAQSEYTLQSEVYEALMSNAAIKQYPEDAVEAELADIRASYEEYVAQYDMTLEEYAEAMGGTMEDLESQMRSSAESAVTQEVLINAIAEKENLVIDDAYYEANKEAFSKKYGFADAADMESQYDADKIHTVMQQERVLSFLVDKASLVDEAGTDGTGTEGSNNRNLVYLLLAVIALLVLALVLVVLRNMKRTKEQRDLNEVALQAKRREEKNLLASAGEEAKEAEEEADGEEADTEEADGAEDAENAATEDAENAAAEDEKAASEGEKAEE